MTGPPAPRANRQPKIRTPGPVDAHADEEDHQITGMAVSETPSIDACHTFLLTGYRYSPILASATIQVKEKLCASHSWPLLLRFRWPPSSTTFGRNCFMRAC